MRLLALGIWCVLLTLLGGACVGPTDYYDVYPDPSIPHAWVDEAVAEWSTFTDASFTVHWAPGTYVCNDHCLTVGWGNVIAVCKQDGAIGCTKCAHDLDRSCEITLDAGLLHDPKTWGPSVTIHEFGHALGLEHACAHGIEDGHPCPWVTPWPAVMNPIDTYGALHVACEDVAQYYVIRGEPRPVCTDPRLYATGLLHLADP